MSNLSKLTAWQILGAYALHSANGEEEEMVALDALSVVAADLGLGKEAEQVAKHARLIRRVCAQRVELREYFEGQLKLDLDPEGNGK